eukprot:1679940-Amphidinium_carterae.1
MSLLPTVLVRIIAWEAFSSQPHPPARNRGTPAPTLSKVVKVGDVYVPFAASARCRCGQNLFWTRSGSTISTVARHI